MISGIQNNLSALNAFDKKMQVTANNIANVNTSNFKKSEATLSEGDHGAIEVNVQKVDTPGYPTEEMEEENRVNTETSNVDLVEEFGEQIITQNAYNANLKLIKNKDEILGNILDILG